MRVLAIDPGDTTGWALLENGIVIEMGQLKGFEETWDWLSTLSLINPDVIVLENFRIRPKHNFTWGEIPPIQIIGTVKYLAWKESIRLVMQEPNVKAFTDSRLNAIKKSNTQNHAVDAAAHGLYWCRKNGIKTST